MHQRAHARRKKREFVLYRTSKYCRPPFAFPPGYGWVVCWQGGRTRWGGLIMSDKYLAKL